jgi:hypothetical protein
MLVFVEDALTKISSKKFEFMLFLFHVNTFVKQEDKKILSVTIYLNLPKIILTHVYGILIFLNVEQNQSINQSIYFNLA